MSYNDGDPFEIGTRIIERILVAFVVVIVLAAVGKALGVEVPVFWVHITGRIT